MHWNYDDPQDNRVVSDGSVIKVYDANNKQMYEQPIEKSQYPAALSFLTGTGKLGDSFDFEVKTGEEMRFPGGLVLDRHAQAADARVLEGPLLRRQATSQVRRVMIIDGQGNRNRFDFDAPEGQRPRAAGPLQVHAAARDVDHRPVRGRWRPSSRPVRTAARPRASSPAPRSAGGAPCAAGRSCRPRAASPGRTASCPHLVRSHRTRAMALGWTAARSSSARSRVMGSRRRAAGRARVAPRGARPRRRSRRRRGELARGLHARGARRRRGARRTKELDQAWEHVAGEVARARARETRRPPTSRGRCIPTSGHAEALLARLSARGRARVDVRDDAELAYRGDEPPRLTQEDAGGRRAADAGAMKQRRSLTHVGGEVGGASRPNRGKAGAARRWPACARR